MSGDRASSAPAWWFNIKPFVNGGLAGCLGLSVMHPVDMIKVRIQLGQGSAVGIVRQVLKHEGIATFYAGWSAQMVRQLTYGTARLGLFQWLRDYASPRDSNGKLLALSFPLKVSCGLVAGMAGAIVGNPAEVALVRMQADKMMPLEERRGYRNVFAAIYRISTEEGVKTLWRGCGPTIWRATAINASSLACYDQTKEIGDAYFGTKNGTGAVWLAAITAGVIAAATSNPFDLVKTQIQQMSPRADGTMPYSGMLDCAKQTIKVKGITGMYVGFPVYCLRISPAVALIFFALELVIETEKKFGL